MDRPLESFPSSHPILVGEGGEEGNVVIDSWILKSYWDHSGTSEVMDRKALSVPNIW
jgi:hypothetical protein